MELGKAIQMCRKQRGYTQSKLAELAGITKTYLSAVERGKRQPNYETVNTVANAMGIPLSIIVFLSASDNELKPLGSELNEKLARVTLQLIEATNEPQADDDCSHIRS